jgi:hypothetical protein
MARSTLEAQLYEITREFVARIVATIRSASFADVAGYEPATSTGRLGLRTTSRAAPSLRKRSAVNGGRDKSAGEGEPKRRGRRPRQSVARRAEIADRILDVLRVSSSPMGARAIAGEVGLAPDLLAHSLRELRQEGRIKKHGDKRATTYSAA